MEFISTKKNFNDARQYCVDRNKILALPTDQNENDLMMSIANERFWIDGTDVAQEGMSKLLSLIFKELQIVK